MRVLATRMETVWAQTSSGRATLDPRKGVDSLVLAGIGQHPGDLHAGLLGVMLNRQKLLGR